MPDGEEDLTLTTFAYGGAALGRLEDGRAVFVPFGVPGERVRIQLGEDKGRFRRGRIVRVLEAAAARVPARCPHFGACGGCHYQHLRYSEQLRAKTEILRDQLGRIGHIQEAPLTEAIGAGAPWNYRNHMQFHVDSQGRLGFMPAGNPQEGGEILPIGECHLPEPALAAFWPQLDLGPSTGIERVIIRAGSDGELMLVLQSAIPAPPELEIEAPVSVLHVFEGDVLVQAGEDHTRLRVLDREFRVSPASFFQVNREMAEKMVAHVVSLVPSGTHTLIDAYCGVGLFSAFLAPRCERLIGIEAAPAACEDFAANLDDLGNVELYMDAAERVLPGLQARPQVVLVDPPRAGLERVVLEALTRMNPERIIYVSCDPATLARDAARLLQGGYYIESITPFDMFPQTYHIESVTLFRR